MVIVLWDSKEKKEFWGLRYGRTEVLKNRKIEAWKEIGSIGWRGKRTERLCSGRKERKWARAAVEQMSGKEFWSMKQKMKG